MVTKRRAVAPVIATLLMVAIAVVGGMLIFVFAQDFFSQTDMMAGPTIEQIQIFGYDARDVATTLIENHEGDACTVLSTQNAVLGEGEVIAVYLRNNGAQDVIINDVKIYGNQATPETNILASGVPAAGAWTMTITDTCGTDATASFANTIAAGKDVTILIAHDVSEWGGEVKVGRPIFLAFETGAGNTFTKQIINGRSS